LIGSEWPASIIYRRGAFLYLTVVLDAGAQPAVVLAPVRDKLTGGRKKRPSLTATVRDCNSSAWTGTEECLDTGGQHAVESL
jgi:hypothetical protein